MGTVIMQNGFRVMQHDDNNDVMIYKDGHLMRKRHASRKLKEDEMIRLFWFEYEVVGGLEDEKH